MPGKFQVKVTRSVERDLEEIWSFIGTEAPSRAEALIQELEAGFLSLERFPDRAPLIPENELLGTEYRHLVIGNYRVLFRVKSRTVYILRIIHGARLLDDSMFEP